MSDVLGPRRRRSRPDAPPEWHDADPWWGAELVAGATPSTTAGGIHAEAGRPRGRAAASRRGGTARFALGLALAPLGWIGRRIRRSERLRRMVLRLVILSFVLTFLACSVGVILVNNVVIGRTAELGKLDERRRELRRENALLDDQVAKLSAPPLVQALASRRLGMVPARTLPTFIFLDPANRMLTPSQRARVRARAVRLRASLGASRRAVPLASPTKETP